MIVISCENTANFYRYVHPKYRKYFCSILLHNNNNLHEVKGLINRPSTFLQYFYIYVSMHILPYYSIFFCLIVNIYISCVRSESRSGLGPLPTSRSGGGVWQVACQVESVEGGGGEWGRGGGTRRGDDKRRRWRQNNRDVVV